MKQDNTNNKNKKNYRRTYGKSNPSSAANQGGKTQSQAAKRGKTTQNRSTAGGKSKRTNQNQRGFDSWQVEDDLAAKSKRPSAQRGGFKTKSTTKKRSSKSQKNVADTAADTKVKIVKRVNRSEPREKKKDIKPPDEEYNDGFYVDEVAIRRKRSKLTRGKTENLRSSARIREPISRKKRKVRNIIMSASILAVVIIIGIVLSLTVLFLCESIDVEGVTKYAPEQIVQVSGLSTGENLFLSDKRTAQNHIIASFPYVEEVDIAIKIPNTLQINIKEAAPAYLIQNGKKYIVVSDKGRILDHADQVTLDVPLIIGCKLNSNKIGDYIEIKDQMVMPIINEIASTLQELEVTGIKQIDISDMANIKLNYEDRIKVIVGVPEDIKDKLIMAMNVITKELLVTEKGDLDVSNYTSDNADKRRVYFKPDLSVTEPPTEAPTEASQE